MSAIKTLGILLVILFLSSQLPIDLAMGQDQSQLGPDNPDTAPLNLELPEEGRPAGLITLPTPFNDYYLVLSELGQEFITDGEILGAFSLALAGQGHFYNAWQFSEHVEPVMARAEVRLDLTSFLVTSGNRALAKDALESAAYILLTVIPEQQGLDQVRDGYLEKYPELLERLIVQETNFFGSAKVLQRIASINDPTVFALAITYYINQFGIGNIRFTGDQRGIPGNLLDIIYNSLQSIADRERYLDNLIALSKYLAANKTVSSVSSLGANELIDEVLTMLSASPSLLSEDRQEDVVALLTASDRLPEAAELIAEITSPHRRATTMIRVAEELARKQRRENAADLFNLAVELARSSLPDSQQNTITLQAIRAMTRQGLWASAYNIVTIDDDPEFRPHRAAAMAEVLLQNGFADEMDKLWVYITPSNLKSSLYNQAAELAFQQGETEKGFNFISNIFLETDFGPDKDGYDPNIIADSLSLSLSYGNVGQINRDFNRAYEALNYTQDPVKRLYIESLMLQLYAQRSSTKATEAFERAKEIIQNMWQYRESVHYPATVVSLIHLLALGGETTLAITQASAMWENPARPETSLAKQQALAYALEEALRQGQIDVARQSLMAINDHEISRRALIFLLRSVAGLRTEAILIPDNP